MKHRTLSFAFLAAVICGAVVVGIIVLRGQKILESDARSLLQVTIGVTPIHTSGLIWIAQDLGYFDQNGLQVTVSVFETGRSAVRSLLDGAIDVATAAEFVLVGQAMGEKKLQAIASIAKSEFHYVIGRKDRGITNVLDFRGKNIGLPRQTSAEFYLGRYLQLHNVNLNEVNIIDLKPVELRDSLTRGEVDAVVAWDPYSFTIEKYFDGNAFIKKAQSGQMMYWLLITGNDFIAQHPEAINRLLISLNRAEQLVVKSPSTAKMILQHRMNADETYLERVWPHTNLGLSLDQGLIIAMEDQSRWLMENNLSSKRKMPPYLDYIYTNSLKKIKPQSVTVIH